MRKQRSAAASYVVDTDKWKEPTTRKLKKDNEADEKRPVIEMSKRIMAVEESCGSGFKEL